MHPPPPPLLGLNLQPNFRKKGAWQEYFSVITKNLTLSGGGGVGGAGVTKKQYRGKIDTLINAHYGDNMEIKLWVLSASI